MKSREKRFVDSANRPIVKLRMGCELPYWVELVLVRMRGILGVGILSLGWMH